MSKFVIIALFIISTSVAGFYIMPQYQEKKLIEEALQESQKEYIANRKIIGKRLTFIQDLNNNPAAINKIAREKFKFCNPGERVYQFNDEDKFQKNQ